MSKRPLKCGACGNEGHTRARCPVEREREQEAHERAEAAVDVIALALRDVPREKWVEALVRALGRAQRPEVAAVELVHTRERVRARHELQAAGLATTVWPGRPKVRA